MNLQFYQEELESSKIFQDFKKAHPKAYLTSAFFTLDIARNSTQVQLDYFFNNKFMVFQLNEETSKFSKNKNFDGYQEFEKPRIPKITAKEEEEMRKIKPEKLGLVHLNINLIQPAAEKILIKQGIQEKLTKIIIILASENKKPVWHLNCITSGIKVIKIKLDDEAKLLKFEKLNLFDFIKKR